MGKNSEMLKTFIKIMFNNQENIKKVIPNMYCKNIYDINTSLLLEKGLKKLVIDIDGTILPVDDINVSNELIKYFQLLKIKKFDICLMSNNNEDRVLPVANELDVKYLYKANKPLPEAFDNALKILNTIDKNSVAMIGDQMLSDIKGANEYGIFSILVNPIDKHNNIQTGTQRVLQRRIEYYLKKKNLFDRDIYYNERK